MTIDQVIAAGQIDLPFITQERLLILCGLTALCTILLALLGILVKEYAWGALTKIHAWIMPFVISVLGVYLLGSAYYALEDHDIKQKHYDKYVASIVKPYVESLPYQDYDLISFEWTEVYGSSDNEVLIEGLYIGEDSTPQNVSREILPLKVNNSLKYPRIKYQKLEKTINDDYKEGMRNVSIEVPESILVKSQGVAWQKSFDK